MVITDSRLLMPLKIVIMGPCVDVITTFLFNKLWLPGCTPGRKIILSP